MFAWGYIAVTAFIAWRWRSKAAYVALPALIGTMALFWFNVGHAGAYSSALWVIAGGWLIHQEVTNKGIPRNSEYVAGTSYGISGLVYVAFYLGASNATLSIIPIVSDLCFGLGLVVGTWPRAFIGLGRGVRHLLSWGNVQTAQEVNQSHTLRGGSEG